LHYNLQKDFYVREELMKLKTYIRDLVELERPDPEVVTVHVLTGIPLSRYAGDPGRRD